MKTNDIHLRCFQSFPFHQGLHIAIDICVEAAAPVLAVRLARGNTQSVPVLNSAGSFADICRVAGRPARAVAGRSCCQVHLAAGSSSQVRCGSPAPPRSCPAPPS